jgi:HK97 gp10 family phage protein
MAAAKVTVDGVDELVRKLQGLARKATPAQARAALMAGALPIQTAAAQKAPVDRGLLRRSIHTETADIDSGVVARIGTNVEYAPAQEFGTSRMRAQPYLRPAYDEQKAAALKEMARALKEMVTP